MSGELVERSTPGIGVAGLMVCPLMKSPCMKSGCMFWAELTYGAGTENERRVGNCAITWTPLIAAEQTQAMIRLTEALKEARHASTS